MWEGFNHPAFHTVDLAICAMQAHLVSRSVGSSNLAPPALRSPLAPRSHQNRKHALKHKVWKGVLIANQRKADFSTSLTPYLSVWISPHICMDSTTFTFVI